MFPSKDLQRIFSYGILFSMFILFYFLVGPFIFEGHPVYPIYLGIDFLAIVLARVYIGHTSNQNKL